MGWHNYSELKGATIKNHRMLDKIMYEIVWPFYLILKTIVIMRDKENFQNNVKENMVMSNGPEPFISNN